MTISTEANVAFYTGNGATTNFSFTFRIPDGAIRVYRYVTATLVPTLLTEGVDFTVSGYDNPVGGSVTLTVAPTASQFIEIRRDVAFTQTTELAGQGSYSPEAVEDALDKLTMLIQQVKSMTYWDDSTIRMSNYTVATLPPAKNGAPMFIYVRDASGGGIPCYSDGTSWRRVDTAAVVS